MTNYLFTRGDESALEKFVSGGGSAVSTGVKGYIDVPFDCYVEEAVVEADQAGDLVVDIWKCSYSQYDPGTHPVDADSITSSSPPTLSSASKDRDTTLTGWTRQFSKGDVLAINVDSCSTITFFTISLKVRKL